MSDSHGIESNGMMCAYCCKRMTHRPLATDAICWSCLRDQNRPRVGWTGRCAGMLILIGWSAVAVLVILAHKLCALLERGNKNE